MPLIKCSSCGKMISDRAKQCIGCGCRVETIKIEEQIYAKPIFYPVYDYEFDGFDSEPENVEDSEDDWEVKFKEGMENLKETGWFYGDKLEGNEQDEEEMYGYTIKDAKDLLGCQEKDEI